MEKKTPRLMTPFDALVTPPILQTLKLILPYTPVSGQQILGTFIKFVELKETLAFFQKRGPALHSQTFSKPFPSSPAEILDDMAPYLPPEESSALEQFSNMMQMMEMLKVFQESYAPADSGSENSHPQMGISPMDMMMGMLTPEQKEMFETYNSLFSNNDITNIQKSQKGDDTIE
ncbi:MULTISPECIES: hypothetical protein [Lachnospiraceae]|jgi:hypothetical protein|uniref:Uncharacterized protein n=1 Tax=Faecalicatena acetigenes TaxID=2981790 RepID=A0ABT2T9S0_9FIRM|nr:MULTISPECIES: hypothetical protein [Lachnospiraceae]MCU6746454.1 hypothetical protein [Faecalicatena acetigenes]RGT72635.1 hypothetical protein DWX08_09120 [Ruminococcus sp. AF18-22]SCH19046.1 Uncharacterised protein [uncultured Clostridium sp.]